MNVMLGIYQKFVDEMWGVLFISYEVWEKEPEEEDNCLKEKKSINQKASRHRHKQ